MSAADPTLAERSRRHRARKAQEAVTLAMVLEEVRALRADVLALRNGVDGRPPPRTNGGGYPVRNGSDDSADSGTLRNGRRAPARARETAAPAPYGGLGAATEETVREDAWRVAKVLTRPGSAGSIVDALAAGDTVGPGMSLARVTAALVHLQAQGQVRREPGEGAAPDRWTLLEVDPLDARAPTAPALQVDPAPDMHVDCLDYSAHATRHAWDPSLGAFRCSVCHPVMAMAALGGGPQDAPSPRA